MELIEEAKSLVRRVLLFNVSSWLYFELHPTSNTKKNDSNWNKRIVIQTINSLNRLKINFFFFFAFHSLLLLCKCEKISSQFIAPLAGLRFFFRADSNKNCHNDYGRDKKRKNIFKVFKKNQNLLIFFF